MIDLYTKRRDKIIVTKNSIVAGGKEWAEVAKKLRVGAQYTLDYRSMQDGTAFAYIYEVPGIKFLAAHFENIRPKKNVHFLSGRERLI